MPIPNRLFVGIDVGLQHLDLALLNSEGEHVGRHRCFPNTLPGYQQIQDWLMQTMTQQGFEELDIAAEATSYYWLPAFCQFDQDAVLAAYQPRLYLLNARWVYWHKQALAPDHKDDTVDPEYIADSIRTHRPPYPWHYDPKWLPLRLLTRFHAHLTKSLAREKNLAQLYTFLAYTQYRARRPFSDPLAKTSQKLLRHPQWLIAWQDLDPEQQAAALDEISQHDLPDPCRTAQRLQEILTQRYPLPEELGPQVQFVLEQLLDLIEGQEKQIDQVDQHIQELIQTGQYPEVAWLDSIRGIGPILSAGLAAEIAGLERFRQVPKWDKRRQVYRPRTPQELEDAIAKIAGLWWPKNSSGAFTAEETPMSKKGNAYLRYYILEAADHMRQWIPRYQAYYHAKFVQATKHKHKRALVLTGRKALGLFVALLRHQEPYRAEEGQTH